MTDIPGTVFITDHDPDLRRDVRRLAEAGGLCHAEYASAEEFIRDYDPGRPGCLVVELHLPGMGGRELVRWLHARAARLPVVVLTAGGSVADAVECMKLGVLEFLQKPACPEHLLATLRHGLRVDRAQRDAAAAGLAISRRLAALTPRESELLRLLVAGQSSKQIAVQLGIGLKTVENHRSRLMRKTGALNAADLARLGTLVTVPMPAANVGSTLQ